MYGGQWMLPLAAVAVAVALLAAALLARPVVRFSYVRGPDRGGGRLEIGWIKRGPVVPIVRWEDGVGVRKAGWLRRRAGRRLRRWDAAVRLLRYAECTEFRWETKIGLEDAAQTAIAAGICWALASSLAGWGSRFVRLLVKPDVRIWPVYGETVFSTELSVAFRIRMYRLIAEALRSMILGRGWA